MLLLSAGNIQAEIFNRLSRSIRQELTKNAVGELRGEIGRLKEKMTAYGGATNDSLNESKGRKQVAELKALRDEMVTNFNEQMKLRYMCFVHVGLFCLLFSF